GHESSTLLFPAKHLRELAFRYHRPYSSDTDVVHGQHQIAVAEVLSRFSGETRVRAPLLFEEGNVDSKLETSAVQRDHVSEEVHDPVFRRKAHPDLRASPGKEKLILRPERRRELGAETQLPRIEVDGRHHEPRTRLFQKAGDSLAAPAGQLQEIFGSAGAAD